MSPPTPAFRALSWPAAWSREEPSPHVLFAPGRALLFYKAAEGAEGLVLAEFPGCRAVTFQERDGDDAEGAWRRTESEWLDVHASSGPALVHYVLVIGRHRFECLAQSVAVRDIEAGLDEALADVAPQPR